MRRYTIVCAVYIMSVARGATQVEWPDPLAVQTREIGTLLVPRQQGGQQAERVYQQAAFVACAGLGLLACGFDEGSPEAARVDEWGKSLASNAAWYPSAYASMQRARVVAFLAEYFRLRQQYLSDVERQRLAREIRELATRGSETDLPSNAEWLQWWAGDWRDALDRVEDAGIVESAPISKPLGDALQKYASSDGVRGVVPRAEWTSQIRSGYYRPYYVWQLAKGAWSKDDSIALQWRTTVPDQAAFLMDALAVVDSQAIKADGDRIAYPLGARMCAVSGGTLWAPHRLTARRGGKSGVAVTVSRLAENDRVVLFRSTAGALAWRQGGTVEVEGTVAFLDLVPPFEQLGPPYAGAAGRAIEVDAVRLAGGRKDGAVAIQAIVLRRTAAQGAWEARRTRPVLVQCSTQATAP